MPGPTYIITTVSDSWVILQTLRDWLRQNPDNPSAPEVRKLAESLAAKLSVPRGI